MRIVKNLALIQFNNPQTTKRMEIERFKANLKQRVLIPKLTIPAVISDELDLLSTLQGISQHNAHYIKQVTEILLKRNIIIEYLDEYYELFTDLITSKPKEATDEDLIVYSITSDVSVKLWETPRVISGAGTTGFRTWEASLFLCEYFASDYEFFQEGIFKGLELGCGTGLVSMFLLKKLKEQDLKLYLTDGDSSLVEKLSTNLTANGIDPQDAKTHKSQRLWWGEDEIPEDVDVIYAADVTYDSSVIPFLIRCLKQGLDQGIKECIISATIRNEDTIKSFDEGLTSSGLKWEVVRERKAGDNNMNGLIWYSDATPDIRIYRITL